MSAFYGATAQNRRAFGSECNPSACYFNDSTHQNPNLNSAVVGDVVLHFHHSRAAIDQRYRCSRDLLRASSPYFDVLLDPTKFSEGREVERKLHELSKTQSDLELVPTEALPVVMIRDVGELPPEDSHRYTALRLFLRILHNTKFGSKDEWAKDSMHALTLVTLLAVIADRFEAQGKVATHVKRKDKKLFGDGKKDRGPRQKEINKRQRILTGMLLGFADWVRPSSASLICEGSERWLQDATASDGKETKSSDGPLWWRLPHGMEEELRYRRECILETISSLPNHFIGMYTSKELQCKLGYDSSPQCDSFQLGEMIRFFARKDLLRLQSTYAPSQDNRDYHGDVANIIEKLRQCPSYQLDSNHRHCGLRTRLLPLLDTLWPNGQAGICLNCWEDDKNVESWLENPTRGTWTFSKTSIMRWENCRQHGQLKAMYTAEKRSWTPSPA